MWVALATLMGCGDQALEPGHERVEAEQTASPVAFPAIRAPESVQSRLRTEVVSPRRIRETVAAPGEVALDLKRVAKVTTRIDGQVERVFVRLGDRVRTGQPLVAIGSLRLDELVQEYLVSKAQADVAANNLKRTEKLWRERIASERRLVEERGQYRESKARYQHVREKLLNMGMNVRELRALERGSHQEGHQYILKAPLDGTVVAQNVVLGQGVSPGVDLMEVVDTSRVWVFASLPIEQARRLKEGDTGTIVPKVGGHVTAPLAYLAPIADERTRTVRVRFDVPNQDIGLRPHEYVEVRLPLESSAALAVPASALTMIERLRGVFVQQGGGYHFVPVEIGRQGTEWVEVTKGVEEGDRVVVTGVFDLKNVLLSKTIQSGEEH